MINLCAHRFLAHSLIPIHNTSFCGYIVNYNVFLSASYSCFQAALVAWALQSLVRNNCDQYGAFCAHGTAPYRRLHQSPPSDQN